MVGLMTIGLVVFGVFELTKLPIDAVPDITDNQVQVITVAPSLGATDIERLVTFPLEQALANIPGTKQVRSFSRFGLSLITIVFEEDVPLYLARQQVSERISNTRSQIPSTIETPTMGPVTTGLGEIYQYVVRPKKGYEEQYSLTELRTIQDWVIRRQLLGTPGVADVSSFGGELKQWEIQVNPDLLNQYGLTLDDVFQAVERNNENGGGSYIEQDQEVLFIRSEGIIAAKEELEAIHIPRTAEGKDIRIRDVADVREGHAKRFGAMCYNDQGEVAGAVVMMLKGENSSEVIKNVKEKISVIQASLPEGLVIEAFLDRTKMVNNAISTVEKNLVEGALIVIFVLVVFLGNFRGGLIVASVIPLSMLFAVIMMNQFNVSGNLMSLGALDFGLIIDGAVIIVEAVLHKMHGKKGNALTKDQIQENVKISATNMMSAAVFGQIIILIVYLPIMSLQGIEGKMFKPMAQTVAFAIIGAFILSLTYVPMMSAWLLRPPKTDSLTWNERMTLKLENIYRDKLIHAIRSGKWIVMGTIAFFIGAILLFNTLGGEFIPELEEGDFAVDTRLLTGSNLTTTVEYTQKTAAILKREFPEIEKVVTKIGSGEIPTDPMPIEAADMMVILKDKKEWTSAKSFDELAEKMKTKLAVVPGVSIGFQYPVQMRFNELMTGARQDVVCKIFGENLDTLAHYAQRVGKAAEKVNGAVDIYVEAISGMPQLQIKFHRESIARFNTSIQEINKVIQSAYAGAIVGQLYEGEKRFDIAVRMNEQQSKDLNTMYQLLIPTPNGNVPLNQLAEITVTEGPNQIQRENTQRRIMVGFNVRGADVETVVNDLKKIVDAEIKLPTGYSITYGGSFENLQEATNRLTIAVPVSLALIFILLYFVFHSFAQSALVFSAIPLSAIGGIVALWMRDMPFSISAGIGFIALFGVAVLNGIVMLTEVNRKISARVSFQRAIIEGCSTRLRPVLMTAAVASLGFLPMALSNGAGAEVQRPLATVVIGGLLTATFLTLFILPILTFFYNAKSHRKIAFKTPLALLVIGFIGMQQSYAQSESEFIQRALSTNISLNALKKEKESVAYSQRLKYPLNPASLSLEYGQVNSAAIDKRISFSQEITSFKQNQLRLKYWLNEEARINAKIQQIEKEITADVTRAYKMIFVLRQKQQTLLFNDSLMQKQMKIIESRISAGDAESWQWQAMAAKRLLTKNSLDECSTSIQYYSDVLKQLCQWNNDINPNELRWANIQMMDSISFAEIVKFKDQRMTLENDLLLQESIRVSNRPTLAVGVSAMTIVGWQNTTGQDEYFGNNSWFYTANAGLKIPLFSQGRKNKLRANEQLIQMQQLQLNNTVQQDYNAYTNLIKRYEQLKELAAMCDASSFKEALRNIQVLFDSGEITFIDWMNLRENYINALLTCTENAIQSAEIENKILKY